MKTVLVKRSIAKDGLPKKDTFYFVYYSGIGTYAELSDGKWLDGDENNIIDYDITKFVTHWCEEIELSKLLQEMMPTEEEIEKFMPEYYDTANGYAWEREKMLIKRGIEWLKSKLSN